MLATAEQECQLYYCCVRQLAARVAGIDRDATSSRDERKHDLHPGALSHGARDCQRAAMRARNLARDREPEPGSVRPRGVERIEDLRQIVARYPNARIRYQHAQ